MTEEATKNVVTIDDVEYPIDDMTDVQKELVSHILDLDRKMKSAQFNLIQMQVGSQAFWGELKLSLTSKEEEAA